ncbi:MAG: AAA family ATPase [Candidatus Methanogaster sp.]|uniref:AAA family ATPase n=1 Tax=Candidatus Methanogaster sp. TaxID=3386292 RepID=A0AC61L5H1_9EURY|nr:MAG: AAA family ATPase [ANME-2 cluster archaeon]
MTLKPWYDVVKPREDLREGKPLDASEFAVHLDQIRNERAPEYYQHPERFFERTYLTKGLESLSAEVIRRLSGIRVETSAVFNMATQFGGGKTHALALLYHLARGGPEAASWIGVNNILKRAGVNAVPEAATAVFVGTEFDSIRGRGGKDGEPLRKTPWGEIAWQLGGLESFGIVEEHDKRSIAPGNDVIRDLLPKDRPCLILMDEVMNYVSRFRERGMVTQFYDFLQNLSEEARVQDRVVLVVSIPASELEMTSEDFSDYKRFVKLLDRVGKAVVMSAEDETSEIIRRRLFEWTGVPDDAEATIVAHADWIVDHRSQVDFPVDRAKEAFRASYPFHPTILSVFERKWRSLPHFQQTRGILRLLALWVSKAYQDGYKGVHSDPLITFGSAPLDDPNFRAAIFEQLGESRLETAVTTDICGKPDAHSIMLDYEAADSIKKARLHRKVATTIFFESNGGQERTEATLSEIRLAAFEPEMDIGNIETVLETLGESCYYLEVGRSRYRFTQRVQLNKMLVDRLSVIQDPKIKELVRAEIQKVFSKCEIERIFFPEKSGDIPDRAALILVILPPDLSLTDEKRTSEFIESFTREYGTSARTFKSALIWIVPDSSTALDEEARKLLAWKDIDDEKEELRLDDTQKRRLGENLKKSSRDIKETVWRTYKHVMFLGKDNQIQHIDLGMVHSSAASSMVDLIIGRLRQEDIVEDSIGPNFLVRKWPNAFKEWSAKSVRDTIFASPQFPRLLDAESIKDTIARGVSDKIIAYGGKSRDGGYEPFYYGKDIPANEIELSDDMFIITGEEAEKHIEPSALTSLVIAPPEKHVEPDNETRFTVKGFDQHNHEIALEDVEWVAAGGTIDATGVFLAGRDEGRFVVTTKVGEIEGSAEAIISKSPPPLPPQPVGATKLSWNGKIPSQKWMNFYTKVLSRFASGKGLKLVLSVEATPEGGVSDQKIEEVKIALRELGLDDDVSAE